MNVAKRQLPASLVVLFSCSWLGCSNPADKVPAASVNQATAPKDSDVLATAGADADGTTYAFVPESSKIGFVGSKVTGRHEGGFKQFVGEFKVADDRLSNSGIKVVIDTTSLVSDNEKLTGHLKSGDFFDVEKFPIADFQSTAVTQESGNTMVTGDLTLHGVTKNISFPATIQIDKDQVSLTSEFSLNRFDFDIKYAGQTDNLIRNEVVIKLDIHATPGQANFPTAP